MQPGKSEQPRKHGVRRAPRVLIADDHVDSADVTAMLLEQLGNDVLKIYDGRMALELAADFQPDIVVLDLDMPGLDGFGVARAIRAGPPPVCECRLIAMTGHGSPAYQHLARSAGFDDFLQKPVSMEQWTEVIAPDPEPPARRG